ncbi:MAG: SdpI family protein, partial [Firmicutes bacterium]|nr:SdpI family protein [Bacillota bacterium]
MSATMLIIPSSMIGIGRLFMKRTPKKINRLFGYRTVMSMKNRDTWEFAHRHFGRVAYRTGWVVLGV